MRLAGNSNSEVVGADTNMRGVDVSAQGGNNGVVNSLQERSLDSSLDIVDQRSLDGRVVDQRFVEGEGVCVDKRSRHLLSLLSHREGLVNHGSLDTSGVHDGLVERSSEGQAVGGVDQGRVRFRLSHGQGDESENYKELHAEACLDCLVPTVIISLQTQLLYDFPGWVLVVSGGSEKPDKAWGQG